MPWSERQMALLRGMGLRLWEPPASAPASAAAATAPAAAAADRVEPATQAAGSAVAAVAGDGRTSAASPPAAALPLARTGAQAFPVAAGRAHPSTLDWPALRQAVTDCRACSLCESRKQTVFGTGHPQAQWLLVGEAPGEQEDEQGEPFVGPAGQLLDRMLAALGLTRAEDGPLPPAQRVYVANALKCRPPRNRNPSTEEMALCTPFLVRQVELLRPRLILAMGRFAVKALLHTDEPIGKLRGRVHRYQGLPVIVSYHPSYLLRSPHEKAKAWEDLCLAASVAEEAASN